jgi:signal transduction histidine kinase
MICLSLKWRISLWVSAVLVVVIATVSVVSYVEFEESHLRQIDRTLLAMANGIMASLDERQSGDKLKEEARAVTASSGPNAPSFPYRVWMDGSSADLLVSDAPGSEHGRWLRELPERNKPSPETPAFVNIGHAHDKYRVVWMRRKINDGTVNIVVAGSSRFTFHELHEFLRLLLILGISLILGSVAATMWTVRCGLRPIDTTAKRLRDIEHPNLRDRIIDERKVPEELRPFVRALTDMLGRLNGVLQRQKQFTSDAAHELRTPLASAKSTLQAAQLQQRQPEEYRRTIDEALEDVARMERLIGQLLVLARMDEVKTHGAAAHVELDVLLRELAQSCNDKAARSPEGVPRTAGRVVLDELPATTVRGDLDELVRLFSNVLDNAVRYGPSGGIVRISMSLPQEPSCHSRASGNPQARLRTSGSAGVTASAVTVRIHDEGGNIPRESLPHLFERFYRVDDSRSSATGGAGLGLAIARQIARRHNGDISVASGPDCGTVVSIQLPLAESTAPCGTST